MSSVYPSASRPRPRASPAWARGLAPREVSAFLTMVRAAADRCRWSYDLDVAEGVLRVDRSTDESRLSQVQLGLHNLAAQLRGSPKSMWPRLIDDHFERMQRSVTEIVQPVLLADVERDLRIQVIETASLTERMREQGLDDAAIARSLEGMGARPFGDLASMVVIRRSDGGYNSLPHQWGDWGTSLDRLLEIGSKNTALSETPPEISEVAVADGLAYTRFRSDENLFVAARMLFRGGLPVGPAGALVALPTHSEAYVFPIDPTRSAAYAEVIQVVHDMRRATEAAHRDGPHALLPYVLWRSPGNGWTPLEADELPAELVELLEATRAVPLPEPEHPAFLPTQVVPDGTAVIPGALLARLRELPRVAETWAGDVHEVSPRFRWVFWATEKYARGHTPVRPADSPLSALVRGFVEAALDRNSSSPQPALPERVFVSSPTYVRGLRSALEPLGVDVRWRERLEGPRIMAQRFKDMKMRVTVEPPNPEAEAFRAEIAQVRVAPTGWLADRIIRNEIYLLPALHKTSDPEHVLLSERMPELAASLYTAVTQRPVFDISDTVEDLFAKVGHANWPGPRELTCLAPLYEPNFWIEGRRPSTWLNGTPTPEAAAASHPWRTGALWETVELPRGPGVRFSRREGVARAFVGATTALYDSPGKLERFVSAVEDVRWLSRVTVFAAYDDGELMGSWGHWLLALDDAGAVTESGAVFAAVQRPGHTNTPQELGGLARLAYPFFIAAALAHARGVASSAGGEQPGASPPTPPGHAERGGARPDPSRVRYRIVTIRPEASEHEQGASPPSGSEWDVLRHVRRHDVIGHRATYTEEAPLFGKLVGQFWIPAHKRGSEKTGQVVKDYRVKPPRDGTPPPE